MNAILLSVVMILSMTAIGASGLAGASPTGEIEPSVSAADIDESVSGSAAAASAEPAYASDDGDETEVDVDPTLESLDREGANATVILELSGEHPRLDATATREEGIEQFQSAVEDVQTETIDELEDVDGIVSIERFWITNVLAVGVDFSEATVAELESLPNVETVREPVDVEPPEPIVPDEQDHDEAVVDGDVDVDAAEAADDTESSFTYGLDQINAPEAWVNLGTQGENARIAVLDTGVDPAHPDIDLYSEEPGNPAHPGGWSHWSSSFFGVQEHDTYPHEDHPDDNGAATVGHGTHVAGTATGGAASGTSIGVAPEAELIASKILGDSAGGEAAIVAAIEWAIEQEADVISMSFGGYCANAEDDSGYREAFIDVFDSALELGTVPVAAAGNIDNPQDPDQHCVSSPAMEFNSLGIGSSNADREVSDFSASAELVTEYFDESELDDPSILDDWPDTYAQPDVVAPGELVMSSVPEANVFPGCDGEQYCTISGTSMATPHVAGTIALLISAMDEEMDTYEVREVISDWSYTPEDVEDGGLPQDDDLRYGEGIVDAYATVASQTLDSGVGGAVVDPDGKPIQDAEVVSTDTPVDGPGPNGHVTGENGTYELLAFPETDIEVTADAFGYAPTTTTVEIPVFGIVDRDVVLEPELDAELVEDQPRAVTSGDRITTTLNVAEMTEYTPELGVGSTVSEDEVLVSVDGRPVEFGETLTFDEPVRGEVTVTIDTGPLIEDELVALEQTIGDGDEELVVRTDATTIAEGAASVAVVGPDAPYVETGESEVENLVDTLDEELPDQLTPTFVHHEDLLDEVDEHEVFVINRFGSNETAAKFLHEVEGERGVVYLHQMGLKWDELDLFDIDPQPEIVPDPVYRLSSVRDDPEDLLALYEFENPPYDHTITVTDDHPIYDGIADVGEGVITHYPIQFQHVEWATFDGYSGDLIGTSHIPQSLEDAFEDRGVLGVDDERGEVLASLGRNYYSVDDAYTDEANELLANAVEHVSDTYDPWTEHAYGDVTQDGEVDLEDVIQTQRHVVGLPIEPTEDFDLELADVTHDGDVGVDDVVTIQRRSIGLDEPAHLEVTDVFPGEEIVSSGIYTVEATIENTGDVPAADRVQYRLGDDEDLGANATVTGQTIVLEPGEETTVELDVYADYEDIEDGETYFHGVATPHHEEITEVESVEPELEVTDLEAPDEVYWNDEFSVNATLVNDLPVDIEEAVSYVFDGDTEETRDVTVESGESTTVEFVYEPADDLVGEFDHGVHAEHDEANATIDVAEPPLPDYAVVDVDPEELTLDREEPFDVEATIENVGDLDGEEDVELRIDGDTERTEEGVELAVGENTTITFEDVEAPLADGEHEFSVRTPHDEENGTLTVDADAALVGVMDYDESNVAPLIDRIEDDVDTIDLAFVDGADAIDDPERYVETYDSFVVNNWGDDDDAAIADFMDELDVEEKGAVVVDAGPVPDEGFGGIFGYFDPFSSIGTAGGEDPEIRIDESHAIFDGVGEDDAFDALAEPLDSGNAVVDFELFDGTGLAGPYVDGDRDGDDVAGVHDNDRYVYLGFGADGNTLTYDDHTEDAIQVFANSVEYVTDTSEYEENADSAERVADASAGRTLVA